MDVTYRLTGSNALPMKQAGRLPAMAGENGASHADGARDLESGTTREEVERVLRSITEADDRERRLGELVEYFPYTEIKNVVEIERDPLLSAALKEWDRKEAYLGNRVDRREKASADLVNQIFNIVGFFSVFQGVVLTAVSTLKSDTFATCGLLWFPIVMSSVAGVVSIVGVSVKFWTLTELEGSIHDEKVAQTEASKRAHKLRGDGKKHFRFHTHAKEPDRVPPKSFHLSWCFVVLSLFLFTALFIFSHFAILCNSFVIRAWKGGLNRP
ncbi:hypothetical protein M758_9G088600 [Ceratodon purpureus]|nr:hypothetical protein M758_9G088600 [Ceratodon purpureus]